MQRRHRCPMHRSPRPASRPVRRRAMTPQTGQTTGPGRDNTVLDLHVGPAYPHFANKLDTDHQSRRARPPLSVTDKLRYAGSRTGALAVSYVPGSDLRGIWSPADADPHTGTDLPADSVTVWGSPWSVRQPTVFTGDGLYLRSFTRTRASTALSHGPLMHRGLRAVASDIGCA